MLKEQQEIINGVEEKEMFSNCLIRDWVEEEEEEMVLLDWKTRRAAAAAASGRRSP
jgi:hypothetical protein